MRSHSCSMVLALASTLVVTGCSSDEVDSSTPPSPPTPTPTATPAVVTATIRAAEGGTVEHPGGARLVIPPGALSKDTTVAIEDDGVPPLDAWVPVVPGSRRFAFDLGGATANTELEAGIDLAATKIGGSALDPSAAVLFERDAERGVRVHAFTLAPATRSPAVGIATRKLRDGFAKVASRRLELELGYVLRPKLIPSRTILDVPFYSQDGLAWCEPTSLAMAFRYFDGAPNGEALSNWWLAGKNALTREAVGGANPAGVIADAGFPESGYVGQYWDIDLLDSTPFKNYVSSTLFGNPLGELTTTWVDVAGFSMPAPSYTGPIAPRPIQATTYTPGGLHGTVIVGADDAGLSIHDSSGALTGVNGIATSLTWTEYKTRIAKPAGDKEPAKDIWTAVFKLPPKAAERRHGSIVMLGGASHSLAFTSASTAKSYSWSWGGAPWKFGAYWDAADCNGGPTDTNWKCAMPLGAGAPLLAGTLAYDVYVANVTDTARTFELQVALYEGGHQLEYASRTLTVPPRSWSTDASHALGTIPVSQIRKAGLYGITFFLLENGLGQDLKVTELPVQ